jgi:hypothetical protein
MFKQTRYIYALGICIALDSLLSNTHSFIVYCLNKITHNKTIDLVNTVFFSVSHTLVDMSEHPP